MIPCSSRSPGKAIATVAVLSRSLLNKRNANNPCLKGGSGV